jgi:hypothetical protein
MQATMHTIKKYHGLQGEEGQRSQAAGVCEGPGVRIRWRRLQRWPGGDRIYGNLTWSGMETSMERTGGEETDTTGKKRAL